MLPLIVTGPTGIGKTALAVRLAERNPFSLVSADSMQVYRDMPIGTAQPTADELRGQPIACCGVVDPASTFNVKQFLDMCETARGEIERQDLTPLYVGGTGMYLRALRWGLADESSEQAQGKGTPLREKLDRELMTEGPEALHKRLAEVDPALASQVDPRDGIRIVRGLESFELTGKPLSQQHTHWKHDTPRFPHQLVVLHYPREQLVERIERRTDAMLDAGWMEEVRLLLARGLTPQSHCFKALGYREIAAHLVGAISESEMREQIKAHTRQFAKRQMTWFRRERDAYWLDMAELSVEDAVFQIEKLLESHRSET